MAFKVGDRVIYDSDTSTYGTHTGVITGITDCGSIIVKPDEEFILVFREKELRLARTKMRSESGENTHEQQP